MKNFSALALRGTLLLTCFISVCSGLLPVAGSVASPARPLEMTIRLQQSDAVPAPAPTLDIARAVPYPTDFPDLASSLGFLDGRFVSGEDQALRTIKANADEDSLLGAKRQLLRAGWLRRYESRLAAPLAGDPEQFGVQVSSFVVEYASPRDAASAFAALAQQHSAAESALVGDESLTLEFGGTTPDTNTPYQAAKLVFRVGPLLCSTTFADLTGAPPPVDAVIAAGNLVAERARIVIDEGTIPLGSMLLQFTERGDARNDVYATRAGVPTRLLSQKTLDAFALPQAAGDAFVSRLASVITNPRPASAPVQDAESVIEIEGEARSTPQPASSLNAAPSPEVSLFTALFSFNADTDASDWLRIATTEAANNGESSLSPIDAPSLGDETVAFQLNSVDHPSGFLLLTRFGSIGIIQELRSSTGVSLEGAANVMRQQLVCIAQAGCSGVAEVPQSVFGGRDVPLVVDLTSDRPQASAEQETPVQTIETPPPAEPLPASEEVPAATVDEPAPAGNAVDVPEELTEPEITSAPVSEEAPADTEPVDVPTEPETTPEGENSSEAIPTTNPVTETPETALEPQETPTPEAAETPTAPVEDPPAETGNSDTTADPATPPPDSESAPAPESTAAPVPSDAPIGGTAPPPVSDVVQTPADSESDAGASAGFTEPAPALTEPDTSGADGDRESHRDRDRKKDRDGRDDKK